jgi:CheY-like chemotaxis protein
MDTLDSSSASRLKRNGRLIVVIEDVEDLAEILVMLLRSEGYGAQYALSGKAGIALSCALDADAVLLDYMLPDMNGAEVGEQLRRMPEMQNLKIVMCTSMPEEIVQPRFGDYDAYLTKPVLRDRLVRTLDTALDAVVPRSDARVAP